ncbi:MAG TPA: FAD binding domain-containing protein [Gemmatimonadaceae bacterium]
MKGAVSPLTLTRPRTIHDAFNMLRDDPELVPLAGCTDLYVALNFGTLSGTKFLDLQPLARLRKIEIADDVLRIGALATFTDIILSRRVKTWIPMLVDAARQIGGPQIQNRGTIGGNIANGSPAGDTLPVLAAANVDIVLGSAAGKRNVKFVDFYTGYRRSVRRPDELILAVEIPKQNGAQWFRKVGTRAAQAISKIVMAAVRDPAGPRIALGSVAATTIRLPKTEASLAKGASIEEAVKVLESEIKPIDDVRSTAEYRLTVATNLLRRFWTDTGLAQGIGNRE